MAPTSSWYAAASRHPSRAAMLSGSRRQLVCCRLSSRHVDAIVMRHIACSLPARRFIDLYGSIMSLDRCTQPREVTFFHVLLGVLDVVMVIVVKEQLGKYLRKRSSHFLPKSDGKCFG